jgi:hypothetical protein
MKAGQHKLLNQTCQVWERLYNDPWCVCGSQQYDLVIVASLPSWFSSVSIVYLCIKENDGVG